jgi:hypothetical protein
LTQIKWPPLPALRCSARAAIVAAPFAALGRFPMFLSAFPALLSDAGFRQAQSCPDQREHRDSSANAVSSKQKKRRLV